MKIKVLNKYSDYRKLYNELTVEERVKCPVMVQDQVYTRCVQVVKCDSAKSAIGKFCRTFRRFNHEMPMWRLLMIDKLSRGHMQDGGVGLGGSYCYVLERLGDGHYGVYLRVSGGYNRFALIERGVEQC